MIRCRLAAFRDLATLFGAALFLSAGCASHSASSAASTDLLDRSEAVPTRSVDRPWDPDLGQIRIRVVSGTTQSRNVYTWTAGRQMVNVLAEFRNFTVLDPENLEAVREEWERVDAGVVKPSEVPTATGLSAPQYIVRCTVTQVESDIKAELAEQRWRILVPYGVHREDRVGVLEMMSDVIDPISGQTLRSVRSAGMFSASKTGSDIVVGPYSSRSERLSRTPEVQAVRAAVEAAAPKIFEAIGSIRRSRPS